MLIDKPINRRSLLKGFSCTATASAVASLSFGLGTPALAQTSSGLVIALAADPPSLDPQAIESSLPQQVTWNIYESLLTRDEQAKIVPSLAESFEQVSPTIARLKLREGVKFHQGETFDADAAVYSINRIIDPDLNSQWLGTVNTIAGARKVDTTTIEIETKTADPVLRARLCLIAMMAPGWVEQIGKEVGNSANGTGPYEFVSWKRNLAIELKAFNSYWGGAPALKTAIFRIVPEDATRFQSIKTGEIDLYLGLLPDQAAELPAYKAGISQQFSFLRLNNLPGSRLTDPRIRQAMNLAVDKDTIFQQLYKGKGAILNGQLSSPQIFGYNPNLQPYRYDVEAAKTLITQAGAHELEITLEGSKGRYTGDAVEEQAIASMLEQIGLHVNLSLRDPNSYNRAGDRGQTPAIPDGYFMRHDNSLFDADRTLSGYYTDENNTYSAYSNAEIKPLLQASRVELDEKKRETMLQEMFRIGREDPVGIFLLQHVDWWGHTARTKFEPRADSRLYLKSITVA